LPFIVDRPDSLTDRAIQFLRRCSTRVAIDYEKEDRLREEVDGLFGGGGAEFVSALRWARERYGGLQYFSESWSFEEEITFSPYPDLDIEDGIPMASLIEHSVAHPFGVWLTTDGAVHYMFPTSSGGRYVDVFANVDSMIESDALFYECRQWIPVAQGDADSVEAVEAVSSSMAILEEASGATESWREWEGVRIHVWRTYAEVFGNSAAARWGVWACDSEAARRASNLLS
jgi:hypothetical protein